MGAKIIAIKNYIRSERSFLLPHLLYLLSGLAVIVIWPKAQIHLYINSFHTDFWDLFFKYITDLGNGAVPFILAAVYVFFSYRKAIVVVTSGTLAGLIAQLFKRTIFCHVPRPMKFFQGVHPLHLVEGVKMHYSFSFPSGHSATIFAVCFFFALCASRDIVKFLWFCLALIVAFSRVYLSQHFLIDTLGGSFIGVISTIWMNDLFVKVKKKWIDGSLILKKKTKA